MLVQWFVHKFTKTIPQASMQRLEEYCWPVNVRELQNVIERVVLNSRGPMLHLVDKLEIPDHTDLADTPRKILTEMEREYILQVLEECRWKIEGKNGAAQTLDMNPGTLRSRMKKLGIQRPEWRY